MLQFQGEQQVIHRHTGGLEKFMLQFLVVEFIHRHTGGLERKVY